MSIKHIVSEAGVNKKLFGYNSNGVFKVTKFGNKFKSEIEKIVPYSVTIFNFILELNL